MLTFLKNTFLNRNRYKTHPEAVIISCFYNPQKNPYRLAAFNKWYSTIKHLNHRIVECCINGTEPQLPQSPYIGTVRSDSILWHKEALLNSLIWWGCFDYKYIFWVDADVLFNNDNWLVEGVEKLKSGYRLVQPFQYCYHLDKNEQSPSDPEKSKGAFLNLSAEDVAKNYKLWRSFAYAEVNNNNYHEHGHVGFAWGAHTTTLHNCPLYDHALVGGADHIMAHAAMGQIPHECITKSFSDDIKSVIEWSLRFYDEINGAVGYVNGDLYHLWHGDIDKRRYLKRVQDFTGPSKTIVEKDSNGLYVANGQDKYVREYFEEREYIDDYDILDDVLNVLSIGSIPIEQIVAEEFTETFS